LRTGLIQYGGGKRKKEEKVNSNTYRRYQGEVMQNSYVRGGIWIKNSHTGVLTRKGKGGSIIIDICGKVEKKKT